MLSMMLLVRMDRYVRRGIDCTTTWQEKIVTRPGKRVRVVGGLLARVGVKLERAHNLRVVVLGFSKFECNLFHRHDSSHAYEIGRSQ